MYISDALQELWPYGFSTIGDVTFDSAAYVARYIMKKVTGDKAYEHYNKYGIEINPEYVSMSRRKGIAKEWFDKNWRDIYVEGQDSIVINGKKVRPPKYYDTQYEIVNPSDLNFLKNQRAINAEKYADNNTPDRLFVRERVKKAAISKLVRNL